MLAPNLMLGLILTKSLKGKRAIINTNSLFVAPNFLFPIQKITHTSEKIFFQNEDKKKPCLSLVALIMRLIDILDKDDEREIILKTPEGEFSIEKVIDSLPSLYFYPYKSESN